MNSQAFLEIEEFCLSLNEAEKLVDKKLLLVNIKILPFRKSKEIITVKNILNGKEEKFRYFELVKNTRKQGAVYPIQLYIDGDDQIFGRIFGMATSSKALSITTSFAGYSKFVKGHGRSYPIELDISSDIIFYREESCVKSDNPNFEMTCGNYRGYLFSCISLIDAYINRHILLRKNENYKSAKFDELINCFNLEERIELFLEVFCNS